MALQQPKETYGRAEQSVRDILGRLQRLIGLVRTAVGTLPAPEGVTGDRDGIRTLGLGINRAFMENGVVDFRGQQIETAHDLALASVVPPPSPLWRHSREVCPTNRSHLLLAR